jgi:hypothetical protein
LYLEEWRDDPAFEAPKYGSFEAHSELKMDRPEKYNSKAIGLSVAVSTASLMYVLAE